MVRLLVVVRLGQRQDPKDDHDRDEDEGEVPGRLPEPPSLVERLLVLAAGDLVLTLAFTLGGLNFSIWRTFIIAITLVIIGMSWAFLARTSIGLRVRGSLENPMLARACGISTTRLYALTFAFGSALAGLAGALIVPLYQLSADIGTRFLVQAFLSVMLGGVGTFEGPVLGSALVGVMAAGLPWVVLPVLADPLVFVIALAIVKYRPQGFITRGRL